MSLSPASVVNAGAEAVRKHIAHGTQDVVNGGIVLDGWKLSPAPRGTAWDVDIAANGSRWYTGTFDEASAIWAAFIETAPGGPTTENMSALQEIIKDRASQDTHQKRAGGKRMGSAAIDQILSGHFNSHPHHWTSGRGGKTAVSAVAAATGLPVSTISEWADENSPARAGQQAGDADQPPTAIPATALPPLAIGQTWKRRDGQVVTLKAPTRSVASEHSPWFQANGPEGEGYEYVYSTSVVADDGSAYLVHDDTDDCGDLIALVSPSLTIPNQETPMQSIPNDASAEIIPDTATDDASAAPDLASLAKGLQGIQSRLAGATQEVKRAREAEAKALAAAQRVNETNKELSERLKESEEIAKTLAANAHAPASVRTAAADDHSHIPTVDATHIADAIDKEIDWTLKHGSDLLITGPTGCGKTAPIIQACARGKRPMRRVCFDGETTSQDLIGRRDALEGKTVWTDGILPQAMEAGQVLLVDEIDRADESARAALFSVLDSRSMYLPVPNKRIVAAPGFQLIAACNGVGDNSGAYTGTQPIDAAFLGRWLDVVRVEYPNETRESAMLLAAVPGINEGFVKKTCEFFKVLRKAESDGNLTGPFSIRQSKRMAQLYFMFKCEGCDVKVGAARAAIRTLIDRTTEDNRSVIREAFQRVYGFECKGA